jgi:thiol-disulfide isomerase/thioredoxin/sugar lactone lactonase YvrE
MSTFPGRLLVVEIAVVLLLASGCLFGCGRWQENPAIAAEASAPEKEQPVVAQTPAEDKNGAVVKGDDPPREGRIRAPEFKGGVNWLNTSTPLQLRDLRGKIVILDFWTFCCINCIHTLPDLAKLEKKYANQLVVVGVHSAKFDNEKDSENIRKAILRYEISHPVVNDANMSIWNSYGVMSWPTLFLIDPEGYLVGKGSGEGLYDALDNSIAKLIQISREKKTLVEKPLQFELARFQEKSRPLFFPGKILADGPSRRLFIADSTHHRIVITDLDGRKIAIAGNGEPGRQDGPFDQACFNDTQGMALSGDTLYVADRKNNLIRALDLKKQTVRTIAGTGEQGENRRFGGPALKTGLNSPWDLCLIGQRMFIAQAGFHQIWTLDLEKGQLDPFAGNGFERIRDGALDEASFAQPSGLTANGDTLYVADSEVSAIRAISIKNGEVKTIVGRGLFDFGDEDGIGDQVRLQHALGILFHEGKLYVADTYNGKIKVIDPEKRSCTTFFGEPAGWLGKPLLYEPGGLSQANGKLYVADTNNHRIQVIDLKTKAVSTLALPGVEPPKKAVLTNAK